MNVVHTPLRNISSWFNRRDIGAGGSGPGRFVRGVAAVALFAALLAGYTHRLRLGCDLTDEAYYALFPVSWVKGGINATGDKSLHQTSALLTYPFVLVYSWFRPNFDGVVFFLRGIYALSCIASAGFLYSMLRRILAPLAATIAALLPIAFIPFGLPAPSYNTLGMLALLCAVTALAVAARETQRPQRGLLCSSAALFVVAAVAHPTLTLASIIAFGTFAALHRCAVRPVLRTWTWGLVFAGVIASVILELTFGICRVLEMARFQSSIGTQLGARQKWDKGLAQLFSGHLPIYCASGFGLALASVLVRGTIVRWLTLCGWVGLLYLVSRAVPSFFAPGHDLIFFTSVAGLPFVIGQTLRRDQPDGKRTPLFLWLFGMSAGLVTSWTASNSLFNFCVGGLACAFAVFIAALRLQKEGRPRFDLLVLVVATQVALAWTSYERRYGEPVLPGERLPLVRSGPYAGLRTSPRVADKLSRISDTMRVVESGKTTSAVMGPPNGVLLLSSLKPRTPYSWTIGAETAGVTEILERFYAVPSNLAEVVFWPVATFPHTLHPVQARVLREHYLLSFINADLRCYVRSDIASPDQVIPIVEEYGEGFFGTESTSEGPYRWALADATLEVVNQQNEPIRVVLMAGLALHIPGPGGIRISGPDWEKLMEPAAGEALLSKEFDLPPGRTVIRFHSDAPSAVYPQRTLNFRLGNPRIIAIPEQFTPN